MAELSIVGVTNRIRYLNEGGGVRSSQLVKGYQNSEAIFE